MKYCSPTGFSVYRIQILQHPFHDPMLPVTVSGRATVPSEPLMRLLIRHLAIIRFGIRPALSHNGERHARFYAERHKVLQLFVWLSARQSQPCLHHRRTDISACAVSAAQSSIIRWKPCRLSASKRGSPPATRCRRRKRCGRLTTRRSSYVTEPNYSEDEESHTGAIQCRNFYVGILIFFLPVLTFGQSSADVIDIPAGDHHRRQSASVSRRL